MNIRNIYKSFINNRLPLIIAWLVFIALRIPQIGEGEALELWGSMFVQTGIALLLLYITQKFSIIRQRTFLPAFLYLLLVGTNSLFFYDLRGSVSTLLVLLCLWLLFGTYQNPLSQRKALNIALVLTLGSFYWTPFLLFFPLFWYGMYWVKSFNLKTFFASLLGVAVVYLFLLAWSIYHDDKAVFVQFLPDLNTLWDIRFPSSVNIKESIANILLGILFVTSVFNIFMAGVAEKAQARTYLAYLSQLTVVISILCLGQNQWEKEWLSILYAPLSIVLAHYFTLSQRLITMWLFLATILFFLLRFALQWIPWWWFP